VIFLLIYFRFGSHLVASNGFYGFSVVVGRQSATCIYTKNSGFASPALGRHISTFRGYQILFSIRNPYINKLRTVFVSATEHCFIFIWKKYRLEFRFRSRDFSFNLFPVWQPSCWRFWSAIVPIHTSTINGITYLAPPSCEKKFPNRTMHGW
jgi:hypothetical protein